MHHSIKNKSFNFPHWLWQNLPLQQGLPEIVSITALWKKYNGKWKGWIAIIVHLPSVGTWRRKA